MSHGGGRAVAGLIAATLSVLLAAARPAPADTVKTPQCQQDLATGVQLINGIKAREKRFVPGNMVNNCLLLRQNLVDMVKAREPMDRCLVGFEHGEAVSQLDASIADMRTALAGSCRN